MTEASEGADPSADGVDEPDLVMIRDSVGVQVGDRNTQIIYAYRDPLTTESGIAPPPLVSVTGAVDSPYRGLNAFEEQDAAFFFGREAAATEVLNRLSAGLTSRGLLVVSGVSGAGKSSLLRAGVIPRLRGTGLSAEPSAATWPCLLLTPTRDPLGELALRIALLAGTDAVMVRRWAASDPAAFALAARQAANGKRLLLVIDQFEQLFTLRQDEAERIAFIRAVHAAATVLQGSDQVPAALVVLAVRADFEARCAEHPELADAVQGRYLLTAMTERQLRLAITEPARQAGTQVTDDLVEVLLAEVRGRRPHAGDATAVSGQGVLPLLSHALDQAWRSRAGAELTLADYERTGGIERAVADSAQAVYDRFTPGQQVVARQVFIALTAAGPDNADTVQRVMRAELTDRKSPPDADDVTAVLEAFAAERLLTLDADSVQISHEALLTAWPLLRDTWLAQTHADRLVRTRLRNAASEWEHSATDPAYLYSGSLLQTAIEAVGWGTRDSQVSRTEQAFLRASDRARQLRARRRQGLIAGLATLTAAAVTAGSIAVVSAANASRQADRAAQQHAIALSRQLAAQAMSIDSGSPVTARRLAAAAWQVYPTSQAGTAMMTLLSEQQQQGFLPASGAPEYTVAFSRNGKLLASGDMSGTIRVWDMVAKQPVGAPMSVNTGRGKQYAAGGLAFSTDGNLLTSTGGASGAVRFWDPATGKPVGAPLRLPDHPGLGTVSAVTETFSPDGKLMAVGGNDGDVRLWRTDSGRPSGPPIRTLSATSSSPALSVAFSPDSKLVASVGADNSGSADFVRLWDVATGRPASAPLRVDSSATILGRTVEFSPNGKLLAYFAGDSGVQLWNRATGKLVRTFRAGEPGGYEKVMAFSPDGKLLATTSILGSVQLWNVATGQAVGSPLTVNGTSPSSVSGLAFSPRGQLLAGAASDGTVRLWNPLTVTPAGAPMRPVAEGKPPEVFALSFAPDGSLLASADGDGLIRLWRPASGQQAGASIQFSQRALLGAALAFNGRELATADVGFDLLGHSGTTGGPVRLWDPATGRAVGAPLQPEPAADFKYVERLAFSPDGTLLAVAGSGKTVGVWGPGNRYRAIAVGATPVQEEFSPDGKELAVADSTGRVRLWNLAAGKPVGPAWKVVANVGKAALKALVFSPDGKLLATADTVGSVQLWNPATARQVGAPLPSVPGGVAGLAFSPDGTLLAGIGYNGGQLLFWDPASGQEEGRAIQVVDRGWEGTAIAFSPDGRTLVTTGGDGAIRLWQAWPLAHPYEVLCDTVGTPTSQEWNQYAPGERRPKVCS